MKARWPDPTVKPRGQHAPSCPGKLEWARVHAKQRASTTEPANVTWDRVEDRHGQVRRECPLCGYRDYARSERWVVVASNERPGNLLPWLRRHDPPQVPNEEGRPPGRPSIA